MGMKQSRRKYGSGPENRISYGAFIVHKVFIVVCASPTSNENKISYGQRLLRPKFVSNLCFGYEEISRIDATVGRDIRTKIGLVDRVSDLSFDQTDVAAGEF